MKLTLYLLSKKDRCNNWQVVLKMCKKRKGREQPEKRDINR
jgi:hypothetical protein